MRRRTMIWAWAAAVGLAMVVGCNSMTPAAEPQVPTYEVTERASFVRRVTAEGYLKAVEATPINSPKNSERPMKIAWVAEDGAYVTKGEVVMRFDATEVERQLRDSEDDVASAERQISKERNTGATKARGRDRTAELAEVELEMAELLHTDDERILSRTEIVESGIDSEFAKAKVGHAQQVKRVEGAVSKNQIEVHDITRRQAQSEVERAKKSLQGLEIEAPNDGILVLERNWRGKPVAVGDLIWMGQKVAEIPIVEAMKAELFVLEADAGDLAEGLAAEVVVEAYPDTVVKAEVTQVDTLAKPRHQEVPVQYFGVTLTLGETDTSTMKVGQRVQATIILEQPDAIVVPRQAVFERDGKRIVYRKDGSDFEQREVEIGASSAGRLVITEGLEPGDEIALRDPTKAAADLIVGDSESEPKGGQKAGPVP